MIKNNNIFFVGPMGSGKTTVGKVVAKSLNHEFLDSDQEIEDRAGANISWIFDVEGEEGFRDREEAIIDELSLKKDIVLSTGGGAVLRKENREKLKKRGLVVYLKASAEQILKRTAKDKKRPLLQTDNREQVVKDLISTRDPLYQEIADITIATGKGKISEVTQDIILQIKAAGEKSDSR